MMQHKLESTMVTVQMMILLIKYEYIKLQALCLDARMLKLRLWVRVRRERKGQS